MGEHPHGVVAAVNRNETYQFSKPARGEIHLIAGLGVAGDAHAGVTVRHRSRVAADPSQPNLRQVHLIHRELFDEVGAAGFAVGPGDLGENVTTAGIDLLSLPLGTILRFSPPGGAASPYSAHEPYDVVLAPVLAAADNATLSDAAAGSVAALRMAIARAAGRPPVGGGPAVVITGLRNPCDQLNVFQRGLLKRVLTVDDHGSPVRKAGVMSVVLAGGSIRPDDRIAVELPPPPHLPLARV